MIGRQFGKWTVIKATSYRNRFGYGPYWVCRCECGVERNVLQRYILANKSGCGKCGRVGNGIRKQYAREYRAWKDMRTRCNNPNFIGHAMYGGRGIQVDEIWNNFETFIADMGECPKGY